MKSLLLTFAFAFLLTLSLPAQDERYFNPAPKAIIGEWKILEPKQDSKIESIIFYPGGFLNIDTKEAKMVLNYKVADSLQGYIVFISGMSTASPFSSFYIKSVKGNNMQIIARNGNNNKTVSLIKSRDIAYGVIPLQSK